MYSGPLFSLLVLFAQENTPNPLLTLAPPLLMVLVLMYFMMIAPERRKQREHQAMLASIKKDDHVVTIGGIYGVVANVRKDADRVTLKIDETTNTKIDVTFGSIARVVRDEPAVEKSKK